jgi:hypothetical protein
VLLELFGLEEKEEDRISPMLRVQAPLYRQGPGYRLDDDLAGCRLLGGGVLGVIFRPCAFPLGRHLEGISFSFASDPVVGKGLRSLIG